MKRLLLLLLTASGAALLAACGGGQVVVEAQRTDAAAEGGTGEAMALQDLPVRLLPYDRDAVFDSLKSVYPEPEPEIPDTLAKLQDAVAQAQQEWKQAESRWGEVRDSLAKISQTLQGMSRAQPQYVALFRDFQELEPQEREQKGRMDRAFARFTQLQGELTQQSEEIRMRRQQWADEAFAGVDEVILAKLKELKRTEMIDTTLATGVAQFLKVKPGQWWVVARYELPYQELYWNLPIEVKGGDPLQVRLTPENAEIRRKL